MFAEEKYSIVLKRNHLLMESLVGSDEEIEFEGTNGSTVFTKPMCVHTRKFENLNSSKEFSVDLYELRNADEENQDEVFFFRMLIQGASDFQIKSFMMMTYCENGLEVVDKVVYFRNVPGDWIWRLDIGKYYVPFMSIKFEVTFGESSLSLIRSIEDEFRRLVLSENSEFLENKDWLDILNLHPPPVPNANISPNNPFAISRPLPRTTSKGINLGSGAIPKVKQKCAKPKQDTCPNTQVASSTQMTASQNQTQLKQKYLVCDTNCWMKSLHVIEAILHDPMMVNYIIYVPHRVKEELDNKKKDRNPKTSAEARKAIGKQRDFMIAYPSRVIQQTNQENRDAVINHYSNSTKADHEIIAACLKLKAEGKDVAIYTNDKNLECEAMANNIEVYPPITPNMRRQIEESKSF